MDSKAFDEIARALAHGLSRRQVLTTLVGVGGLMGLTRTPQPAAAAPGPPPAKGSRWPACSEARPDYCVRELLIDGVDHTADTQSGFFALTYYWTEDFGPDFVPIPLVQWDLRGLAEDGQEAVLTQADVGKEVLLRLRTGRIRPDRGLGVIDRWFVETIGSDETGWEVTVTGRVALQQISNTHDEHATHAHAKFSGAVYDSRQDTTSWRELAGQFVSSSAGQSFSWPLWRNGGWEIELAAPHFAVPETTPDGVNHGFYYAMMSPDSVATMGLTVEEAVAGQLLVTRTDGSVTTELPAEISERHGVYIALPDLTFSSPIIRVQNRARGGGGTGGTGCAVSRQLCSGRCVNLKKDKRNCGRCGRRCRSKQTCRRGRCVRKGRR